MLTARSGPKVHVQNYHVATLQHLHIGLDPELLVRLPCVCCVDIGLLFFVPPLFSPCSHIYCSPSVWQVAVLVIRTSEVKLLLLP